MQQKRLVNEFALSRYLGGLVSPGTLRNQRIAGSGPPFLKIGRRVAYDLDQVDTWLASRARRSTSDPGREAA